MRGRPIINSPKGGKHCTSLLALQGCAVTVTTHWIVHR